MNPKEEAVLQLIAEDKAFEDYFFKTKKNVKWFYELRKRGYFKPEKNPSIQPADREGYYVIPQWNVLEYLEKVAQQVNDPANEKYVDDLLEIIKEVTNYKNDKGEVIDNYRTWWFFIKILLCFPNHKIPIGILDLVPVWLSSKFGSSLVDADTATKLLPKFLFESASEDDIRKSQKLVDYLTDFIWVKKKGVFTDHEDEPKGVVEDHWLIDSFVTNGMAKLVGKLCDVNTIYSLAEKLKATLKGETKNNWLDIEEKTQTYRFSVNIKDDYKYICKVGVYQKKAKDGRDELLHSYSVKQKELFEFIIEADSTESFSGAIKKQVDKFNLPENIKQEINIKSEDMYRNIFRDYSYIWFKNLSSISDSKLYDFRHVILAILAEALIEKANTNVSSTKEIIKKFLFTPFKYQVFKRLILVVITKYWDSYKEIFWNILLPDQENPLLEEPSFENEMRHMLRENITKFSEEEKARLNNLISIGPKRYLIEDNKDKYIMYWKQRWYGVVKDDPYFSEQYESIRKISKYKDEEETVGEWEWVGPGSSSIKEEEFLKMSNLWVAEQIDKFKQKDIIVKGPTSEGLANSLENAVKKQPEKFVDDLEPFINTGFYYVYHIIDGFKDAWKEKTSFDWTKVLSFIERYIDRADFWKNKLVVHSGFYNADNKWIVGVIGELIEEGTRNDEWSIPADNFPTIKKIFSLIANNVPKDEKESDNFPSHVLNCGLGKVITGLVYFILRIARIEKTNDKPLWDKELKSIFETFLSRNIYDAYTVLGEYLISFAYLDKEWTKNKIETFFMIKDKVVWEAFMSGYLTANRVNLDLYKLMKKHYVKGLSYDFEEKILNERLIDHIGIAYLNGEETIERDGLLKMLWDKWNSERIKALIDYFWTQRENLIEKDNESELNSQMRARIVQFWRDVYKYYRSKEDLAKKDKGILSEIAKLTIFIPMIDEENYQWLMLSALYIQEDYNSSYFLECLNALKDKGDKLFTARKIGNIFLEMLKSFKPDYDLGDIQSIIEYLYSQNTPEISDLANNICNEYARSGIEIVTGIYKKHNP